MKKLFAKLGIRDFMSFDSKGIQELKTDGRKKVVEWDRVTKVVFIDYFEEYSGYCLTDEYKSKKVFNKINVNCKKNLVKVRTGGKQSIKKNVIKPFRTRFGTTCIYYVVCVEYITVDGKKNMYITHYDKSKKKNQMTSLKDFISEEKIQELPRADGFIHLVS